MREGGFIRLDDVKPVDICLIPFSERELASVSELAQKLRREGKSVDIVLTDRRLGDKLKYASRVAKFAAVIGEDETKTRIYRLKTLPTALKPRIHGKSIDKTSIICYNGNIGI